MSSRKKQHILYAGDSAIPGAANYLVAILASMPHLKFTHIPPGQKMSRMTLKTSYDAILLSDYSKADLPRTAESALTSQVKGGAGLLMIGGWGSFSGPFGGWRKSAIEELLPVRCLERDDRVNYSGGSLIQVERSHIVTKRLPLQKPPVICGFNEVRIKPGSRTILSAQKIFYASGKMTLEKKKYPLLVVDGNSDRRIAAFTTDFAPHWCGGLVDWGVRHKQLQVNKQVGVEVGDAYIRLVQNLMNWLVHRDGA